MKSKLTIVCLLLFILCTLSAVTAQDLNDTQVISQIDNGNVELENVNDEMLTDGAPSNLQEIINSASEGSTVKLSRNYTPEQDIKIDKAITIDGAGNTIDASKAKIELSRGTITLKNLIFVNGNYPHNIFITGSAKCSIINATFKNCRNTPVENQALTTLTVINSRFLSNHGENAYGGAIFSKGMLVVENSTFTDNTAYSDGGAISAFNTVELTNCIFSSNKVTNMVKTFGGAVYSTKDIYAENCTFADNSAKNFGGAIYANGNIIVEKSKFIRNTADIGGAIRSNNDNSLSVVNSRFINNSASKTGGAISTQMWVYVGNSTFVGNTAGDDGGAIRTDFIQLGENVTFTNNSAKGHGGAVYANTIGSVIKTLRMEGNHADSDFGGGLYINNKCPEIRFYSCVFTNNYAIKGDGGAIHSDSGSTDLKFYSCTFAGNYATGGNERRYGGAVRSNGNVYVENSTFKDNWAENYGGAIYTETASEIKYSVFVSNQVKNGGKRDGGAIYINKACTTTLIANHFEKNGGAEHGGAIYTDSKNAHLKIVNNAFIENSADEGKTVFNTGYYDDVSNNWWATNGASMDNQLKEYHTIGSNEDHKDSYPLTVTVSGSNKTYTDVKTTIRVSFQNNLSYYTLSKITYESNKKGSFEAKFSGNALQLTYTPNETGIHTINFTINGEKISFNLNATYISVYGYDLVKSYGSDVLYSAVFKDKNGSYLPKGTKITFNVDNVDYNGTVEDRGIARLHTTLEAGNYTVKAINTLTGESFTNRITVTQITRQFNIGDVYIMKLDGVINKTVSVKLGDKTYDLNTSKYGIVYLPLNVSAGNYTVEVAYNGKTVKDNIAVLNRYSIVDLELKGTTYGALLPVYANEKFTKISNGAMYSVLGDNTYRYVLASRQAFIFYNVTVSNSDELTKVLRKISSADFKADVIQITLKKNTYKITENFWRDSEWYYLIHLTHGRLFIDGGGSTIDDDYHHNFICLEPSSSVNIKNLAFTKFYRVFANGGEVNCVNVTFNENDAQFVSTMTPGSVIYNNGKATFENCIFNNNKNHDVLIGHDSYTMGGVLYAGGGSITSFVKCQFLSNDDNIHASNRSMVVFYDDTPDNYNKIIHNSYIETFSCVDVRKTSSFNKNHTVNFNIAGVNDILNVNSKDNSTLFGLLITANDGDSYNVTLKNGEYVIKSEDLEKLCKENEWRTDYINPDSIPIIYHHDLLTVKSKPIVINGNGATIKITGNSISDDFHFAYIPHHGSLTLINLTVSGFNGAFINYGTLILVNCTFENNQIHYKIKVGDYGGVINNYGDVFCYNSAFTNNAANLGGAYYSESGSSTATFSNCRFSGNVLKSNWVWNNNDENAVYIKSGFVKFVHCSEVSSANIKTDKEGKYSFRDTLNNTIYNMKVDSMASLMRLASIVKDNTEYDIINVTFAKMDYGVFPNSKVLLEMDYGLLIINGEGAKVFVQNPNDSDETQFLTTTGSSNVQLNNITVEGFNIAINNKGKLKIMNSHFNKNRVDYKFKSDYGGAIVNEGILSVLNTTFTNNYAKYGGAVYNKGASRFVMCNFTNNNGYDDNKNIDIYNNDGSVEFIVINTKNPNMFEKHPMAQWKQDLVKSSIKLLILMASASTGWMIAASELSCAAVLSTTINAIIGGSFGALEGFIFANDKQNYDTFWVSVLEGIGDGMSFTDLGEAAYELRPLLDEEMVQGGLTQIYTLFRSKTIDFAKSLAEAHENDEKFDDIDEYIFFNT